MISLGRVLFVDDEPALLEGLRRSLRREPYDLITADSAAAALEILGRTSVDVVVSDESMPGMAGSEFLTVVCRRYPETIRIMLTGNASLDVAVRAINQGEIYRFLMKPCSPRDLAYTIKTALELKILRLESTRLLAAARHRGSILSELERRNPGITHVDRAADGAIDLTADSALDPETLINEIRKELGSGAAPGEPDAGSADREDAA